MIARHGPMALYVALRHEFETLLEHEARALGVL